MTAAVRRRGLIVAALIAIAVFVALGVWQVERRAWKLALIAQVDRRLAAAPVAAPGPALWPRIGTDDAYTRISARGRWISGRDSFVQAVTELGGGFWVMTPLATDRGWTVLVNRGFVPGAQRSALPPPPVGPVAVTGLLRIGEPHGGFLRTNDPAAGRWYSRDVAAIAAASGVGPAAPYFIDADATANAGRTGWPRGGMTVVQFRNTHLVYALTWFGMALLVAVMTMVALRRRA